MAFIQQLYKLYLGLVDSNKKNRIWKYTTNHDTVIEHQYEHIKPQTSHMVIRHQRKHSELHSSTSHNVFCNNNYVIDTAAQPSRFQRSTSWICVNKWLEHSWDEVIHTVKSLSDGILYISTDGKSLVPWKCLAGTNSDQGILRFEVTVLCFEFNKLGTTQPNFLIKFFSVTQG